jgi:hypothetical protein
MSLNASEHIWTYLSIFELGCVQMFSNSMVKCAQKVIKIWSMSLWSFSLRVLLECLSSSTSSKCQSPPPTLHDHLEIQIRQWRGWMLDTPSINQATWALQAPLNSMLRLAAVLLGMTTECLPINHESILRRTFRHSISKKGRPGKIAQTRFSKQKSKVDPVYRFHQDIVSQTASNFKNIIRNCSITNY